MNIYLHGNERLLYRLKVLNKVSQNWLIYNLRLVFVAQSNEMQFLEIDLFLFRIKFHWWVNNGLVHDLVHSSNKIYYLNQFSYKRVYIYIYMCVCVCVKTW